MTTDPGPWHARIAELEAEVARLREEAAEREANIDVLVSRCHERAAELDRLRREGKTERRFTNNYIKTLHSAESRLAEATALLLACESILLDVLKVEGISGTMNYDALVAFIARLRAFLDGHQREEGR